MVGLSWPLFQKAKRSLAWLLVRANAWVSDSVFSWGAYERQLTQRQPMDVSLSRPCFSPSLAPSLPLSLKINTENLFLLFLSFFFSKIRLRETWKPNRKRSTSLGPFFFLRRKCIVCAWSSLSAVKDDTCVLRRAVQISTGAFIVLTPA